VWWKDDVDASHAKSHRTDISGWALDGMQMHPDWRPGGAQLSFLKNNALTIRDGRSPDREIAKYPGFPTLSHESWSPSGDLIVIDTPNGTPSGGRLVVLRVANGVATVVGHHHSIYTNQMNHAHAHFSPDGTKIVFNTNRGSAQNRASVRWQRVRRPMGPTNLHWTTTGLTWKEPRRHREIARYRVAKKVNGTWGTVGYCFAPCTHIATHRDSSATAYHVTAIEHWGLHSLPSRLKS
jgi:Tol biopolymer transport system component